MNIVQKIISYLLSPVGKHEEKEITSSILFDRFGEPISPSIRIAAIALLTRAAWADGKLNQAECETISELVQREFALAEQETKELVQAAFGADPEAIHTITGVIRRSFDADQRVHVLQLVWKVMLSDHHLPKKEKHLAELIGQELGLTEEQVAQARTQAEA